MIKKEVILVEGFVGRMPYKIAPIPIAPRLMSWEIREVLKRGLLVHDGEILVSRDSLLGGLVRLRDMEH